MDQQSLGDLIERLYAWGDSEQTFGHCGKADDFLDAASEITRLREENKLLREALGVISQRMEALEDESFEGLSAETTEHAVGFWRGQKFAAKSLRLHLHDMTRTAPATTGGE